jgi:hypothetical protein
MGDFVLSILVPEAEVREYEVHEDPPLGWPFREYWLTPDIANKYRDSLEVWVPGTEEQVPAELLSQDHAVIVTDRFGYPMEPSDGLRRAIRAALVGEDLTPEQEELLASKTASLPSGALCVCGEQWRWNVREDQEAAFMAWSSGHLPT